MVAWQAAWGIAGEKPRLNQPSWYLDELEQLEPTVGRCSLLYFDHAVALSWSRRQPGIPSSLCVVTTLDWSTTARAGDVFVAHAAFGISRMRNTA